MALPRTTQADLDAVQTAEAELARLRPRWEAQDLIPTEEVPEGEKTREPRNMNFMRWRDLFLPRQLLTNVVILEEIRAAQVRARAGLPEAEAEAVSVYLALMLSKIVNYNSASSSWHDSRQQIRGTMMGHDLRFHAGFTEMEGARETVMWGASQVIGAYEQLARLIHGEPVSLEGADDEGEGDDALDAEGASDEEMSNADAGELQEAVTVAGRNGEVHLRPEVIVPTVTCDDAAALSVPAPGTVHLICVDPPYYNNVQYAELSNFFYVWLKRALHDWPGLAHLFREPLTKEEMQCPQTEEGLLELVVALSHYTEEGYALFPQVILCDDLSATLRLLQCSDPLHIDTGPREPQTMTQALKRCAPLARGGWVVYMQRFEDHIEYGVFRAPSSPTALDIRDTVQALTEEAANLHIILASQLTDKAVELVGARSGVLHLYLSATPDNAPSPRDALDHLITACCDDVAIDAREQVQSFLRTTLSDALRHCHGTLVGVLTVGQNPAEVSSDGVILREPISFTTLVKQHEIQRSDQSLAALTAYGHLLAGMLSSDGIVLLDSECKLLGYNLFVRDDEQNTSPPSEVVGGARRRAYMKLRQLIDRGTLQACFICSSDGRTGFYKRGTP